MTGLCSWNIPRYFLDFAFYHYPCTTAGGQVVPEGTCRVVILYYRTMLFEYPSVLSRFCVLPLSMYHCWCTSCPRGYLSGSNFILPDYVLRISLGTFSIRISLGTFSILLFTTTHVPLLVDKLSPRVLVG